MKLKSGIPNYYKKLWKQDNQVRTSNYQINFDDFCKGEDEETVSNDKEITSKKEEIFKK